MKRDTFTFHASRFTTRLATVVKGCRKYVTGRPALQLLLVWLLSIPAVTPLIQPTLTHSADGLLHLYRLVVLDHALRQGAFWLRWLPDLAFGYGLPLFVFYAPLSYYLTEVLHLLGLGPVAALNASFALALFVSGTGMYLFVRDCCGSRAGVLAGVAYVYAPYPLFDVLGRGSLPIAWAGAIFPFAFWSLGRLIETGKPIYLPLSALTCGAALLVHNISSLLFMSLLVFYLLLTGLAWPERRTLLRAGLALSLGLGLATFFLGPAIIEKKFVQVERVITPPDFDYHFNFVDFRDLLALPPPANTGLLNPDPPFSLGPVQVALATIGLLSLLLRRISPRETLTARRVSFRSLRVLASWRPGVLAPPFSRSPAPPLPLVAFALIALAGAIFMMLSISVGLWERLPLIAFVQQPHRLLSLTAFLLAILAGLAVTTLPDRWGFGLTLTGIVLIFISAAPLLYPRYYTPLPAAPTLNGMMAYEHATGVIGTTSFGEYLPVWVQQIPRESPLEPMYQAGTSVERLDRTYLPPAARLESASYGFNRADLVIDSPEPYQAIFHTFYFPGWQAQLDGRPVDVAPVSERGLIGLSMPAGRHRLQLYFTETPVRLVANSLSLLSLLIVIFTTLSAFPLPSFASRLPSSTRSVHPPSSTRSVHPPSSILHPPSSPSPPSTASSPLTTGQFIALTALAVILILLKSLYLDHFDNPLKHVFAESGLTGAGVARQSNFGRQVNLLGYDLNDRTVSPGQSFDLTLYWQARRPLAIDYSALAQLVDAQGHLYVGQDNLHPGGLPTTRWEPWGFARDPHTIQVPAGTPPGDYFLITGLYEPATGARLPVLEGGEPGWTDVVALPVTVLKPSYPPTLTELDMAWPVSGQIAEVAEIRLLGATPERSVIRPNDFLRVALFWEAIVTPGRDYGICLRLLDNDDAVRLAESGQPAYGLYPTTRWHGGERVRDNHALWLPPDFPAGTYRLQVQVVVAETGRSLSRWLELGQVRVED